MGVDSRVEWNPTGDVWEPCRVLRVNGGRRLVRLDDGQELWAETRHLREVIR
jgi:hypothetical protein